ncbi:TetR/AcrR family transcriptional regulator [Paradesertivirga mongoliensis]|uniref:TetR/AcrR family transcriptional regulator n=1 Tax=Paradesertivirga mongoliensis TaxID=2100740 RepID=A0ABW4ZIV1_9SPHI|nr:TetR/AcrR family transcriptional regulator [Pedobacter mongoliensis]
MELSLKFNINQKLSLRNPEESDLGRKIIQHGIVLVHQMGFEVFTFKKLAKEIGTTEASIYRYFENKHRLLLYIVDWYWSWQEYRLMFQTNNIASAEERLKIAISLLSDQVEDDVSTSYINEKLLYEIVMSEGAKSYLTKHVAEDNKAKFFKPYKDLCARIAGFIRDYNPDYKYPFSLSSTIIEMAHSQKYYMHNLPSLTDFGASKDETQIVSFLENLVFSSIRKH